MPLFLVGARRLLVATLVVADYRARVAGLPRPAPAAKQDRAAHVQRTAHLLHRHLGIFPPAGGPCGPPRSPARSRPGSDAAPAPGSAAPRSGSTPLLLSPPGSCARSSRAGTPPPAPAPRARLSRWSRNTSA